MQPCTVRVKDRPALARALRDSTGREREGGGRGFGQHPRGVLGDEERGEEAHQSGGVHRLQTNIIEGAHGELVARGEDHMVQLPAFRKESGDVTFDAAGVTEVAGMPREAGFGGRVGFQERGDGGFDPGRIGGGEHDGGAGFKGGFSHAVANPGRAADNEDARGGEFVSVFSGVGHSRSSRLVVYGRLGVTPCGRWKFN